MTRPTKIPTSSKIREKWALDGVYCELRNISLQCRLEKLLAGRSDPNRQY